MTEATRAHMSPREATALTKKLLAQSGLPFTKVSSKEVSFEDLARGSRVFTTVFLASRLNDTTRPIAEQIEQAAREKAFSIRWEVKGVSTLSVNGTTYDLP